MFTPLIRKTWRDDRRAIIGWATGVAAARTNNGARTRPVREKHARLAVHALVEYADLPWKDRSSRWNATHPTWACSEAN